MEITGNLRTTELAEVLQWLTQGEKTGALVVDNSKVQKKIFFARGSIVASASTEPSEYLGHFLVGHGFISEMELATAVDMQAANSMLLGKILVTVGGISEEDLRTLLTLKTEEAIYSMFAWPEGEFRFVEEVTIDRGMIPISLDVTRLTLEGMQRLDEWSRIREIIPSGTAIPVAVGALEEADADPRESRILSLVDDNRTIQEISLQSHTSEFITCEALYRQVQEGRLKIVQPREGSPVPVDSDISMSRLSVDALLQDAERHLKNKTFESALGRIRAARSLDPSNQAVLSRLKAAEEHIRQALEEEGLDLKAVPQLKRSIEELTTFKLSPEDGFVLSRINGKLDVQSIVKISPMNQLDCHLIVWQLVKDGHITLEPPDLENRAP